MKPAVIYPRGFLGYDIGLPISVNKDSVTDILSSLKYNRLSKPEPRVVISNTAVKTLMEQMLFSPKAGQSQEWREAVLTTALKAFGTRSFYEWCSLQEKSPYLSDLHVRFLNDTLRFIQTGVREMSIRNWSLLVHPSQTPHKAAVTYDYRKFFGVGQATIMNRSALLRDIIPTWVARPGGYADLLQTLNIVFGEN